MLRSRRMDDPLADCLAAWMVATERQLMDYLLSDHARKRIQKRKIRVEWLEATLTDPVRTESDAVDPTLVHALRPIPERGFRVLRVIYNETRHPPVVVTAYFDSEVNDR